MSPDTIVTTAGVIIVAAVTGWVAIRNTRSTTKASTTSDFIDNLQKALESAEKMRAQDRTEMREEHRTQMAEQRDEDSRRYTALDELLGTYRTRLDVAIDHAEALHRHIDGGHPPPAPLWPRELRLR